MTVNQWLKNVYYDPFGQYIWSKQPDGGSQMVCDIRGWGALQHEFDTMEEAEKFQDEVGNFIAQAIKEKLNDLETVSEIAAANWVKFDFYDLSTRPTKSGKYLICRKDGNIHWETWNTSGWAYNHNVITHWAVINSPKQQDNGK